MEEFRGYAIEVTKNNEKEYPFKAIARKDNLEIKHKGATELQAIDFVKESINHILAKIEIKSKK